MFSLDSYLFILKYNYKLVRRTNSACEARSNESTVKISRFISKKIESNAGRSTTATSAPSRRFSELYGRRPVASSDGARKNKNGSTFFSSMRFTSSTLATFDRFTAKDHPAGSRPSTDRPKQWEKRSFLPASVEVLKYIFTLSRILFNTVARAFELLLLNKQYNIFYFNALVQHQTDVSLPSDTPVGRMECVHDRSMAL